VAETVWGAPGPQAGPHPGPQPDAPEPPTSGERSTSRLPAAIAGAAVLVVGVLVALALWYLADARRDDAIAGFARAPAGCDTTLLFDTDGRYVLFVETEGTLDGIGGDCSTSGAYSHSGVPSFDLAIIGPGGTAVPLWSEREIAYDASGFVGMSVGSVEIVSPGQYVMRVASDDDGFVIAVGTDPNDRADALRIGALVVVLIGALVGALLLAYALLRRTGDGGGGSSSAGDRPDSTRSPWAPSGTPGSPPAPRPPRVQ
jgi:hypothetical protein